MRKYVDVTGRLGGAGGGGSLFSAPDGVRPPAGEKFWEPKEQ